MGGNDDAISINGRRAGNNSTPSVSGNGRPYTITAPPPKAAAVTVTGEIAVAQSKRDRAEQETVRITSDEKDTPSSVVRNVGNKTFYLRDGVWTDAEFNAEARKPETTLTFGSDEYFALLQREPRLAKYFSLGERVVVVYGGRVYRVNAATK